MTTAQVLREVRRRLAGGKAWCRLVFGGHDGVDWSLNPACVGNHIFGVAGSPNSETYFAAYSAVLDAAGIAHVRGSTSSICALFRWNDTSTWEQVALAIDRAIVAEEAKEAAGAPVASAVAVAS